MFSVTFFLPWHQRENVKELLGAIGYGFFEGLKMSRNPPTRQPRQ
jgi:hypothetical protein